MICQLPYLSAIIKEGMRIEPPAALIPTRETDVDVELEDISLKKDVSLYLLRALAVCLPPFFLDPSLDQCVRHSPRSPVVAKPWQVRPYSIHGQERYGHQASSVLVHAFQHEVACLVSGILVTHYSNTNVRDSLGNQFSLVEQTVFMCSLLTRFKWTTLEYEPSLDPIISKPNKLMIQLTPL